jgi:hypothetical protein
VPTDTAGLVPDRMPKSRVFDKWQVRVEEQLKARMRRFRDHAITLAARRRGAWFGSGGSGDRQRVKRHSGDVDSLAIRIRAW